MYIYILIYRYCLYHVAFGNFVPSAVLFSLQICNFYWFVFVRRCVLCLMFTIQHIFKKFFLSKFSFETLTILSVAVFITALPPHFRVNLISSAKIVVKRVHQTTLKSERFVNAYQFIPILSVMLKKNSSVKGLVYPFWLSKCFGRKRRC